MPPSKKAKTSVAPSATSGHDSVERPPIMPLDLGWVKSVRINSNAVSRSAAEIGTRRTVKKDWQAAWLLRAITNIDLTTLAGDDTPGNVARLCSKARNPVKADIMAELGCTHLNITCGAVCVYPARVPDAVAALKGSGIPVAAVATGFPSGQITHEHKLEEIRKAVADGATEIDIVIPRTHALNSNWEALYKEVCDFRVACGDAHMKTILATGELPTYTVVYQCSLVCMMAGADFIKTSTGKEPTNATLPVSLVMVRAIREYYEKTGYKVGFKPAGGIRTAKDAATYLCLMREELGFEWQKNHLFRIGASALLNDIERQVRNAATSSGLPDGHATFRLLLPPCAFIMHRRSAAQRAHERALATTPFYLHLFTCLLAESSLSPLRCARCLAPIASCTIPTPAITRLVITCRWRKWQDEIGTARRGAP